MSVVGFDLGYQSCHVAIVRHGGVEVIFNEYSDRRSLSLVAFSENRRLMGHSAKNQQIMNFKNTIYGFRDLIGRKFSDHYVQQEIKNLPFSVVRHKDDEIGIEVTSAGEPAIFSPEQVTAMMLTYLKKTAENALERPVVDCVISVPSYFTDAQRRGLLDASTMAGLNCLRLFNETTASALAYGIYKQDLPVEPEKPRNVVFVDMGYSSLQVAICSFQKGKLTVLARTFNCDVGGRHFDFVLLKYFSDELKKKYKIDLKGKAKQVMRLLAEVEKVKKMMSTVTTPIPMNIECFYNDRDVSSSIKREVFEELCGDHFVQVRKTLSLALAKSKLSLEDIDSVEILGGSCRIPAIKDAITDVFKRELSTTLNLDEAVCRGCGLQCAMLSPTFKVRDFSVTDIQPYGIKLNWEQPMEGDNGEMIVYKEGDNIYHSKMLTFYRKEPFQLVASYAEPDQELSTPRQLGTFNITKVTPTEEGEATKVKVKVRMNIHGIFFIKDATMVEKQKQPPPTEPEAMDTDSVTNDVQLPDVEKMADKGEEGKTTTDGEGQAPNDQEEKMNDDSAPAEEESNNGANATDIDSANGKESDNTEGKREKEAEKPPAAKKQKKPTVKYVDLPIVSCTASLTKKELDHAREIEVQLNYQDQLEQEKADARNSVEEYVYSMRDKLYNLTEFVSEDDKAAFNELLTQTEDWLYDEGEDQAKKVYVERLNLLKKSGDPILMRQTESEELPKAFNELGGMVVHYEKVISAYDQGDEAYAHLDAEEMGKVKEQVKGKRQWLETQMQACQASPKHVNPPVSSSQTRAEAKNLQTAVDPIVNKPKPKVEPPKDDQPKADGEDAKMDDGKAEDAKMDDGKAEDAKVEENKDSQSQNPPAGEDMDLD